MENEQILSKILDNTEKLRHVIVKDDDKKGENGEELPKEQTPQQKAIAKFKRVGTQLNKAEQDRFEEILKNNDTNANAFIKELIFGEEKRIQKDKLLLEYQQENESLKNAISKLESDISTKDAYIESIEAEKDKNEAEIKEFLDANTFQILKYHTIYKWNNRKYLQWLPDINVEEKDEQ